MKWNDLPVEIQERMLECQVEQGNLRNPEVFKENITNTSKKGGFNWCDTKEGGGFWSTILSADIIDHFYTKYPKPSPYPKLMMVSSYPITYKNKGWKRVVFMEKNGKYLAWGSAETLEQAEHVAESSTWKYAKDIEPESEHPLKDIKTQIEKLEQELQKLKELL